MGVGSCLAVQRKCDWWDIAALTRTLAVSDPGVYLGVRAKILEQAKAQR